MYNMLVINKVMIRLLEDAKKEVLRLDSMTHFHKTECGQITKSEMQSKAEEILDLLKLIIDYRELVMEPSASGVGLLYLNFFESNFDYQMTTAVFNNESYLDILPSIDCESFDNRLFGRVWFMDRGVKACLKQHYMLNSVFERFG